MSANYENRRENFLAWIKRVGTNIAQVSAAANIPRTTLYGYARGDTDTLKGPAESKIASAFKTTVEVVFGSNIAIAKLGVYGKIGARADVYPTSDFQDQPMYEVDLPPGIDPSDQYIAFEIDGFSMPPAEPGWLVVFRTAESDPKDLLNSACLVELEDGRRLFKRLRKGYADGLYNLESWDGSPLMENVTVLRALPFASLTPGRTAR